MVEHVEKQMLQMPMLVVRAEKQMLKVGTWRQMLLRVEKQMGKLETGRHRPTDATTWGGNLIPENESFQRRCKEILDILTNIWGGAMVIHLCHSETNSSQQPKLEEFGGVNKRGIIGKERRITE